MAYRNTPFLDEFNTSVVNKGQWYLANYTQKGTWNYTSFKPYMVTSNNGKFEFTLNDVDISGKKFTGSEVQSNHDYHYGRYEADIQASGASGVVTTFFTYGGSVLNEIDIELVGRKPNEIHLAYHRDSGKWEKDIKVDFDTTTGSHHYAFEWRPDSIRWFADGKVIASVENPAGSMPSIPDQPTHLVMNLWSGIPGWLGAANFTETKAYYDNVQFTPLADIGGPGALPTGTVKLFLYDADTDRVIGEITDGQKFRVNHLPTTNLTVVAEGDAVIYGHLNSVKFDVSGGITHSQIENGSPFAAFGDATGANFHGRNFVVGGYHVEADAFSGGNATGSLLGEADIDFTIAAGGMRAYLVDATKDIILVELKDGMTIDNDLYGTSNFTVLVTDTQAGTASVKFDINGPVDHTQIENVAPWALFGDRNPNFHGRTFAEGSYTLEIDAYAKIAAKGTLLDSYDLDLLFV